MKMQVLQLDFQNFGIGVFMEAEADIPLATVLTGIKPLEPGFFDGTLTTQTPKQQRNLSFPVTGWTIQGSVVKAHKTVLYESLPFLVSAFNTGLLKPASPSDPIVLKRWGIVNDRGQSSLSRLQKLKSFLADIGLIPVSRLKAPKRFELINRNDGKTILAQRAAPDLTQLHVSLLPVRISLPGGTTFRSASWIAQPCQSKRKYFDEDRKVPYLYFDGSRLRRITNWTALSESTRADFDANGRVTVVPQEILLPPVTWVARHIVDRDEVNNTGAPEADDEFDENNEAANYCIPACAAVRLSGSVDVLSQASARKIWSQDILLSSRIRRLDVDGFICHRADPTHCGQAPDRVARSMEPDLQANFR